MNYEASPNQQPQPFLMDIPHTTQAIPRLRTSGLPHTRSTQYPFDYESLFSVMQSVEVAQEWLDFLPTLPDRFSLPNKGVVEEATNGNGARINELIHRIGGIPVRFVTEEGDTTHGHVIESPGFTDGKWVLLFRSATSGDRTRRLHTTQEIRQGYLAAILPAQETFEETATSEQIV